jgi:isopentenyl-diphosphate Delta-isomerase
MGEKVILVDEFDRETGVTDKMEAHKTGQLHRAVSVLVFNSKNEWLLQQRAALKYHSAKLWTNTCCSHPHPGESAIEAAERRLMQEMGIQCKLKPAFQFKYKTEFDNGLTEHEWDHVFIGYCDDLPKLNPDEVMDWKYISPNDLKEDILQNPFKYTEWMKIIFGKMNNTGI